MLSEESIQRFWDSTNRETDCWEWTKTHDKDGYGWINIEKRKDRAHRIAWIIINGSIPAGMCVLHHCDNPPCINPAHLWLGTRRDNTHDRMAKGRPGGAPVKDSLTTGVYWDKSYKGHKHWRVAMTINHRQRTLGRFSTQEEALQKRLEVLHSLQAPDA